MEHCLIKVEHGLEANIQHLSDKDLVGLSQDGDEDAFEELMKRYQNVTFNMAYRLIGNYDDALDLTQDVFLRCFKAIADFRQESKFSTWLYSVTLNLARNRWKQKQARALARTRSISPIDSSDDGELVLATQNPGPRKVASDRQMVKLLEQKLLEISFEKREALILRFVEGLSYDEISKVLKCSLGTVKSRINRGRIELRSLLSEYSI